MREDLKSELFKIAINRARAYQYGFTSILEKDLKEYIEKGVDNMTSTEYFSDTKKIEAKVNTMILVDAMAAQGRIRNLNESLDFKSFSDVRSSICPLWPFC